MFLTRCEIILGDNLRDKRSPIERHSAIRLQSKKFANKNMNTPKPNNTSTNTLARRAPILVAAASLLLAPCLFAQAPTPEAKSAAEKAATAPSDAAAPWVEERFGRPTPDVLHWSVEPAVTKAFEPSGVFDEIMHCGEFTVVSNYGLYWSGEGDPDDSKDMQASVVILKGQQRVFVARGYQFDKFNYDDAKKTLNFHYWTGVQGDGQIVEFTMDFASGALQPKTRNLSSKGEPVTAALQKGGEAKPAKEEFYTLKFDGGEVRDMNDVLRKQLSAENVVIAGESLMRMRMPAFELRNVRLAEIARTIEFLGEGNLQVEVAENAGSGDLWRIGRKNTDEASTTIKMRSVAAPHLFADEKALADIQDVANDVEMKRLEITGILGGVKGVFRGAVAKPLASQKIFAITGDEEGVAGLESLINAAEKRLSEANDAKVAAFTAIAPKVRAVLAPHVFAEKGRLNNVTAGLRDVELTLRDMYELTRKLTGSESVPVSWADARPQPEHKIFVLRGTEAGIAGMESIIRAAEQLAVEEDEKLAAEERVARARDEEKKARAEAELKAGEEAAKEGKSEE